MTTVAEVSGVVVSLPPDKVIFPNTILPDIVELRGVTQSYPGKPNVIEDLDFLIEDKPDKGQFVVILGESGCGKSTVLRYIAGLQKPTFGQVLILGQPIGNQTTIPMVFQDYSSYPWMTVLDNVMLPLKIKKVAEKEAKERAADMLQRVGLADHGHKFANRRLLSGGQLQRVAIARSLIAKPDIVLMDEPFGALDPPTRTLMQHILVDLWEETRCTIVFITHSLSEAVFLADDLYIMKAQPGRIARHLEINLPYHRDAETNKLPEFHGYIDQLTDMMNELKTT